MSSKLISVCYADSSKALPNSFLKLKFGDLFRDVVVWCMDKSGRYVGVPSILDGS